MSETPTVASRVAARREQLLHDGAPGRSLILVPAGLPVPIAGTDQAHDFHAHAEHYYLTGLAHPGGVLAFDPSEGWTLFAQQLSREDQVWTNASERLEDQAVRSGLDRVRDITQMGHWIERRRGEPVAMLGNPDLSERATEYGIENWHSLEIVIDEEASARLAEVVSGQRRTKDESELERMRAAAAASVQGHLAAWRLARPGLTERRLQVELEAEFFRNGAQRTAYGSIVGTGPNGSVLHFEPTSRELRDGDIVLIDAGAEIDGYASDVTRAFPAGGRFAGIQRDIYQLVLDTQQAAIDAAAPGVEYKDLHMGASRRIAQGLADLGILRGDPDSLVERDAHALFFPHGLGHMLGLATHDAGGCLAGRERSDRFGLNYLRTDLPLEPGYVVTIEPGIYFIRALLTDPERRATYADAVNWDRIDAMMDFGGIRIEDDVLITAAGPELLSGALPREIDEIEALREEALQA